VSEEWPPRTLDPAGRVVVFDAGSHLHLFDRLRHDLLEQIEIVLGAVADPDFHEDDPLPGRERFYRADFPAAGRWLRVVVDFNQVPAPVVTAFALDSDPRLTRP
jgi:hypothetical protein